MRFLLTPFQQFVLLLFVIERLKNFIDVVFAQKTIIFEFV